VDAFADSRNHRFPRWWGDGGESPDAFQKDWGQEGLLWCNPPFEMLAQITAKLIAEKGRMVLVCPDWPSQGWLHSIQKHVLRRMLVPKGTLFFELDGRPTGPTQWDTWVFWIEAGAPNAGGIPARVTPVTTESPTEKPEQNTGQSESSAST